jgi:Subtilase family
VHHHHLLHKTEAMKIPILGAAVAAATAAPLAMMLYLPPAQMRSSAAFVPDPLISTGDPESAYGKSVTTLFDAQLRLTTSEGALKDAAGCLALLQSGRRNRASSPCRDLSIREAAVGVKRAQLAVLRARKEVARAEDALDGKRGDGGARGVPVEQGTILVLFRKSSPQERTEVLRRHGLIERSQLTDIPLYITQIVSASPSQTAEGLATRVRALVESLRKEGIVETAVQNVLLGGQSIPRPTIPPREWLKTGTNNEFVDPLVVSGFPATWNLNDAVSRTQAFIDVGVLDVGFTLHEPNDLDIEMVCSEQPVDEHGTIVASIIGAKFDNGEGIDGAAPFARLHGCAPKLRELENAEVAGIQEADLPMLRRKVAFDAYLAGLEKLLSRNMRVVNASIGYNWGEFVIRPSTDKRVQDLVESQGKMVRAVLRRHSHAVVVSAAGNDCRQVSNPCDPAMWTSPINWAGLNTADPAPNVIVVQGLDRTRAKLAMSNVEAMIAAVGEGVPAITAAVKNADGTITDVVGTCPTGTSCAAPLITAAVAQLLSVNQTLTASEIRQHLGITPGSTPELKAIAAMRASFAGFSRTVCDYDLNTRVELADFERFKTDFRAPANAQPFCRSDFDGDGDVDAADLTIMMDVWMDGSIDRQTLPARLLQ